MGGNFKLERPCPFCRSPEVIAVLSYPDLTFICTMCQKQWRVGGPSLELRLDELFSIALLRGGMD